jgi:hypothetical protein
MRFRNSIFKSSSAARRSLEHESSLRYSRRAQLLLPTRPPAGVVYSRSRRVSLGFNRQALSGFLAAE